MMRFIPSATFPLALAGSLLLLLTTLWGLILFFPGESLRPLLVAEGAKHGLRVNVASLETSFPFGLIAKEVVVSANQPDATGVKIDRIDLTPVWSRLLLGQGVLSYHALLLGGEIEGKVARRGPLTLSGTGISWRGPLPGPSGGSLVTRNCQGEISASWPAAAGDPLSLALKCEETIIEGLLGSKSPLLLGSVTLNAGGQGKDLRLTTLTASGGQLTIDGSGTILLNESFGRSLLNLNLSLQSHAGLDPTLGELLSAFVPPASDGTSRLRLTGTLAAPQKSR